MSKAQDALKALHHFLKQTADIEDIDRCLEHAACDLKAHKTHLMSAFELWKPSVEDLAGEPGFMSRLRVSPQALVLYTAQHSRTFPDWFVDYMVCVLTIRREDLIPDIKKVCAKLSDEALLALMTRGYVSSSWDKNVSLSMLDLFDDQGHCVTVVEMMMIHTVSGRRDYTSIHGVRTGVYGVLDAEASCAALIRSGECVAEACRQLWDVDLGERSRVIYHVLKEFYGLENADVLVEMLGHAPKDLHKDIQYQILKLGRDAEEALRKGKKAKKKAVKTFCAQQLDALERGEVYELNVFEKLPREARLEMLATLVTHLNDFTHENKAKKRNQWARFIKKTASRDPLLWCYASMYQLENRPGYVIGLYVFDLITHVEMAGIKDQLWLLFLHKLCRVVFEESYTGGDLIRHVESCPLELKTEHLSELMFGAEGSLMKRVYSYYFATLKMCDPRILCQALAHNSKVAREAAITGALNLKDDPSGVVALLQSRKKATRLCAIQALGLLDVTMLAGHKADLETARSTEKVEEIQQRRDHLLGRF